MAQLLAARRARAGHDARCSNASPSAGAGRGADGAEGRAAAASTPRPARACARSTPRCCASSTTSPPGGRISSPRSARTSPASPTRCARWRPREVLMPMATRRGSNRFSAQHLAGVRRRDDGDDPRALLRAVDLHDRAVRAPRHHHRPGPAARPAVGAGREPRRRARARAQPRRHARRRSSRRHRRA